jgi:hypothetical protein
MIVLHELPSKEIFMGQHPVVTVNDITQMQPMLNDPQYHVPAA